MRVRRGPAHGAVRRPRVREGAERGGVSVAEAGEWAINRVARVFAVVGPWLAAFLVLLVGVLLALAALGVWPYG